MQSFQTAKKEGFILSNDMAKHTSVYVSLNIYGSLNEVIIGIGNYIALSVQRQTSAETNGDFLSIEPNH